MSSLYSAATASTPLPPKSSSATPLMRRRCTVVTNVENPPKHEFAQGDFTSFSMQVSVNSLNTTSVSDCLQFTFKKLSNRYRSISRIFLNLVFGGFLQIWPNCAPPSPPAPLRLPPPSPIMPRLSCTGNSSLEPRNEGSYNTVGLCVVAT